MIKHGVNKYFLVLQLKTRNAKKISQTSPKEMRNEHGLLVPQKKRQKGEKFHISICMSEFNAVMCGTTLMLISQKTFQVRSYSFSHIHLFYSS